MSKLIDLTGQKFGRLTVVSKSKEHSTKVKWLCKCDCGNEKLVSVIGSNLKSGYTKSCGCLLKEKLFERNKKENVFVCLNTFYIGTDTNGNKFKFDKEDYEKVSKYTWVKTNNGYFSASIDGRKKILLHRLIMDIKDRNMNIDHINHDTSDNRKENLRIVNAMQNACNKRIQTNNKSGVKGVSWNKDKNKWQAKAMQNYKNIHLGYFNNFEDAKKAREEWEIKNQEEYRYNIEKDVTINGFK